MNSIPNLAQRLRKAELEADDRRWMMLVLQLKNLGIRIHHTRWIWRTKGPLLALQVLRRLEQSESSLLLQAEIEISRGCPGLALKLLSSQETHPISPRRRWIQARAHLKQGNPLRARKELLDAVGDLRSSSFIEHEFLLGCCYVTLGHLLLEEEKPERVPAAITQAKNIVESINGKDLLFGVLELEAQWLLQQNNIQEAQAMFEYLRQLAKHRGLAIQHVFHLKALLLQRESSESLIEKIRLLQVRFEAMGLDGELVTSYVAHANALAQLGDVQGTRDALSRATCHLVLTPVLDRRIPWLAGRLADFLVEQGHSRAALEALFLARDQELVSGDLLAIQELEARISELTW